MKIKVCVSLIRLHAPVQKTKFQRFGESKTCIPKFLSAIITHCGKTTFDNSFALCFSPPMSKVKSKHDYNYTTLYRDTPMKSQDTMNLYRLEKSTNLTSLDI